MELVGYLPAGSYTTDDTLQVMSSFATKDSTSSEVANLAHSITAYINPNDHKSMMIACRNWILANLAYVPDAAEAKRLFGMTEDQMEHGELEAVKSPIAVLESRRYDCDCAATLIAAMLISLGIPVRFMAVGFAPESLSGPDGFSHVFAQGFDGSEWITLDPVSHPHEKRMLEKDAKQVKIFDISG